MPPKRLSLAADILLVNAGRDQPGKPGRVEHLGLGYLAAVLKKHGFQVEVCDANFHGLKSTSVAAWLLERPSYAAGFSVFLNNVGETLDIIRLLREAGDRRLLICGGHHPTFNYQEMLEHLPQLDSIVLGEGETPLLALMQRLSQGAAWHDIPGLAWRADSGQVMATPCGPLIVNLEALPFPDRRPYEAMLRQEQRATVLSSRGCYGQCAFCSIRAFYGLGAGKLWRGRSAHNVVDEIERLVRDYGVRHIEFADDNLLGGGPRGKQRAREIGEEILRRELDLEIFFICRPNDVDRNLLEFLKQAGLKGVDIGVESWVPRQLALYNKRLRVEDNLRAVAILKELDLISRFYLIPSDPYATVNEVLENLARVETLGVEYFPDSAIFNRLTVFKGSPLETRVRQDGLLQPPQSGFSFMGALNYRFAHPELNHLHACGDLIYREYRLLSDRLAITFSSPQCHDLEKEFHRNLDKALRQAVLALFKASAESCLNLNEDRPPLPPTPVQEGLHRLKQQVADIEGLHARGQFHTFADVGVWLGDCQVLYPPRSFRQLVQLVCNSGGQEETVNGRSAPD